MNVTWAWTWTHLSLLAAADEDEALRIVRGMSDRQRAELLDAALSSQTALFRAERSFARWHRRLRQVCAQQVLRSILPVPDDGGRPW